MEVSYRFIDIDKTQETTNGYADMIPREGPTGRWYVPKLPLTKDQQVWNLALHGKVVAVPLVQYLVNPDMLHLFAFAAQLGVLARDSFDGASIRAIRMSVGGPFATVMDHNTGNTMWKVYFGVAIFVD